MSQVKQKSRILHALAVCLCVGMMTGLLVYKFTYVELNDLYIHQGYITEGRLKEITYPLWHYVTALFHFGLHIQIEKASAFACACFNGFFMAVIWSYFYSSLKNNYKLYQIDFMAFILCVVQPLYWKEEWGGINIGRSLTNPLSNPTQMTMRPMALLATLLTIWLWDTEKDEFFQVQGRKLQKKACIRVLLAVLLFLSVLAKPSFAQIYYFAFAFVLIVKFVKSKGKAFWDCFWDAASLVPSMIQFLLIYFVYFGDSTGAQSEPLQIAFLEIWSMFTDSVPLSILAALAFAIAVLVYLGKEVQNYKGVIFCWFMTIVGILEYMLFMETGGRQLHGNFSWGYQIGCSLLWVFSLQAFLKERKEFIAVDRKKKSIEILIWFLLIWHLLSGIRDFYLDFTAYEFHF